jgi:hypothetical protein
MAFRATFRYKHMILKDYMVLVHSAHGGGQAKTQWSAQIAIARHTQLATMSLSGRCHHTGAHSPVAALVKI